MRDVRPFARVDERVADEAAEMTGAVEVVRVHVVDARVRLERERGGALEGLGVVDDGAHVLIFGPVVDEGLEELVGALLVHEVDCATAFALCAGLQIVYLGFDCAFRVAPVGLPAVGEAKGDGTVGQVVEFGAGGGYFAVLAVHCPVDDVVAAVGGDAQSRFHLEPLLTAGFLRVFGDERLVDLEIADFAAREGGIGTAPGTPNVGCDCRRHVGVEAGRREGDVVAFVVLDLRPEFRVGEGGADGDGGVAEVGKVFVDDVLAASGKTNGSARECDCWLGHGGGGCRHGACFFS